MAARQARQFSREILLGDRRVITRARMLLDPRNASRGRLVTSASGNREACGDDPCGSLAIFSDVGLFRGRRPVLCGALSETVRLTGSSRGRLRIVSSFAFTVIMLGRRPRRHCCTRFVVRCARPARGEAFARLARCGRDRSGASDYLSLERATELCLVQIFVIRCHGPARQR